MKLGIKKVLPQIRSFFGEKLGSSVSRFAGTISPIRAHRTSQFQLAKNTANIGRGATHDLHDVWSAFKKSGYSMSDYFSGKTFRYRPNGRSGIYGNQSALGIQKIATRRSMIAGAAGLWAAGKFFMGDNPASNTVSFGASAAVHTAATGMLGKIHPGLGMGYAGVALMNLARPNNNWGPF